MLGSRDLYLLNIVRHQTFVRVYFYVADDPLPLEWKGYVAHHQSGTQCEWLRVLVAWRGSYKTHRVGHLEGQ